MTTETRKRIRAYKKALPELRERVVAVALLLAMSVSMMASASFAWLTISRNPEVSGASTTIAANGNLEIALATGTTSNSIAPGESQVGDSSAAEGQSVTASNVTWGNLINLSDPSYGLDNLTLRPAQLNKASLLINPLFGAEYQSDGRVEKLNSNFRYARWKEEKGIWRFFVSDDIGVRAISSTTVEAVGFGTDVYNKRSEVKTANLAAGNAYIDITENADYMNTLAAVMGKFMMAKMNAGDSNVDLSDPSVEQKDLQNLRDIFRDFIATYDLQFVAMAKAVNFQLFMKNSSPAGTKPYTEKTAADIKGTTEAALRSEGLQLSGLNQAKIDYANLLSGYEKLQTLAEQGSVRWTASGLNGIVNSLMSVGKCTLDGTPINNIGVSNAFGYLEGTHEAVIHDGVLWNFERLNGQQCYVKGLTVNAKIKKVITVDAKVNANISTSAKDSSDYPQIEKDLAYAETLNTEGGAVTEVAQDTYGLALDVWVRTNAADSYLTLEGNVLTTSEEIRATGTDINGSIVELWTVDRIIENEDGTTETVTVDLYKLESEETDENGNTETVTTWYNSNTHSVVELTEEEQKSVKGKMTTIVTVVGFEGENRVWEDANAWKVPPPLGLSLDSTTQGSGSCYVYYADTPEDQARSLKLLAAMNVAFVDDTGALMATAEMDTARFYAENGRVTVPLVLRSDSIEVGTDSNTGESIYAITALEQNVPKRITAIVYLDGTKLGNGDVLAASDIQGKLNIQFGSSVTLSHAKDEALLAATRSVTATVDKTEFAYDESKASGTPMTTNVTLTIDGDAPKTVTGFFIRAISSTQGSREDVMTFEKAADGSWQTDYTFTAPGVYMLRSVELDGQTYDLASPPTVTVEGFTIKSLTMGASSHTSIMTAASSYSVDLSLEFASSDPDAMPATVQGRFLRTDGTAVNVNFTYNATTGTWTGTANFIASGEYTMQYLVLDGEYTELDEGLWKTASVKLGMKTAVYTSSPSEFLFTPSEWDPKDEETSKKLNLAMQVSIMDNTGNQLQGLQGAHLYYARQGSTIQESGMNAPLTWDASKGYYTCTFQSKIGVYTFSHVTVDSNTITYAETAPTFRILSPNPPCYDDKNRDYIPLPYVYNPKVNTVMQVNMTDSAGTSVMAVIRNLDEKDETHEVMGVMSKDENGKQTWDFLIPVTGTGDAATQDGNWQLETIKVWNCYDEDGALVTEESPLEFAVTGHITKAVTTVNVTVNTPENYDHHLGNSATSGADVTIASATAAFLDTQTVSVPTVTIVDFEGQPVGITNEDGTFTSYVSGVKFDYAYTKTSDTHGGYTSSAVDEQTAKTTTVTLVDSGDHKTFTQSNSTVTVTYAGTYTPKLGYTISGVTYSKTSADMGATSPTIEVWSKKPTVTISSVSTNPTTARYYLTSTPNSLNVITGSFNKKLDDFNAVVYMYVAAQSGMYDHECLTVKYPTVTLSLSGVPTTHEGAIMTFPGGNNTSSPFSFGKGETTAEGTIGAGANGTYNTGYTGLGFNIETYPIFYPAGKQTVNQIKVTHGGIDFTVDLSRGVTINNPLYPPTLSFEINDADYTANGGQVPASITSVDGETVTLPGTITLPYDREAITGTATFSATSTTYKASENIYYNYNNSRYRGYYKLGTLYSGSAATTTYHMTKTISQWVINGVTYNAGDTVTLTGNATATAVVATNEVQGASGNKTLYKWVYSYVATGDAYRTEGSWGANGNGYTVKISSITATAESPVSTSTDKPANVPDF